MLSIRRRRSRKKSKFYDDCNIDRKKCETDNKNYNKQAIADLAEKCGVDIYNEKGKVKTRKELCKDLEENRAIDVEFEYDIEPDIEDMLPMSITENAPLVVVERESTDNVKRYTKQNLKGKKKQELLEIADELGIEKWNNKSIKYQKNSDIIDAIIYSSPDVAEVKEPIIIVEEETQTPVIVVETEEPQYTYDELLSKSKKELLKLAENYGVEKWLNKGIKYHNKPEIVDAIIDYVGEKKVAIPSVIATETPIKVVSPIKMISKQPSDILNLIYQKRQELINAIECNPTQNKFCSDDNVCDTTQTPNVCISKEEGEYRDKHEEDTELVEYNGKKILGTKSSLDLFTELTGGVEESKGNYEEPSHLETVIPVKFLKKPITKTTVCNICTFVNDPGVTECIICNSDFTDEQVNNLLTEGTEIVEKSDIIPEGTEIVELKNIEDILNEIQETDDINLKKFEGMDEAKKKVLYCLGLID